MTTYFYNPTQKELTLNLIIGIHGRSRLLMRVLLCAVILTFIGFPSQAAEPSDWSDKTLCRVLGGDSNNVDYQAEAKRRQLTCNNGAISSALQAKSEKMTDIQGQLPVRKGLNFYPIALLPAAKAELLVDVDKTSFDFSGHQLAYIDQAVTCLFDIRPVHYENSSEGELEKWNTIAAGEITFTADKVQFDGQWKQGGFSKDPKYLKGEANLKLTKSGHLVGKMAYFRYSVDDGDLPREPIYIDLMPHEQSQPFNIGSIGQAEIWFGNEQDNSGVLRTLACW